MRYYYYAHEINCSFLYIPFPYRNILVKKKNKYIRIDCEGTFNSHREFKDYIKRFFESDKRTKHFMEQHGLE